MSVPAAMPPAPDLAKPLDADQASALAVLEHANAIRIERWEDRPDRWQVVDTSFAEPEVNWPGADLGGPYTLEEAIRVRKEAQADVLERWRKGLPPLDPYGRPEKA